VTCVWEGEDPMVGHSFYGALDVKIMDRYVDEVMVTSKIMDK
jgi:hypothetical protein